MRCRLYDKMFLIFASAYKEKQLKCQSEGIRKMCVSLSFYKNYQ